MSAIDLGCYAVWLCRCAPAGASWMPMVTCIILEPFLVNLLDTFWGIQLECGQWAGGQWMGGHRMGVQWMGSQWMGGQWMGGQWMGGQSMGAHLMGCLIESN